MVKLYNITLLYLIIISYDRRFCMYFFKLHFFLFEQEFKSNKNGPKSKIEYFPAELNDYFCEILMF